MRWHCLRQRKIAGNSRPHWSTATYLSVASYFLNKKTFSDLILLNRRDYVVKLLVVSRSGVGKKQEKGSEEGCAEQQCQARTRSSEHSRSVKSNWSTRVSKLFEKRANALSKRNTVIRVIGWHDVICVAWMVGRRLRTRRRLKREVDWILSLIRRVTRQCEECYYLIHW